MFLAVPTTCATTRIQTFTGANEVYPGAGGTVYALGQGSIATTPGAYLSVTPVGQNFLEHVDPVSGAVLYATDLDFFPSKVYIDKAGAAYVVGISHDPNLAITPGAYDRHLTGGEEFVVSKLNPQGSAMEFLTLLGGSAYPYNGSAVNDLAVAGDGAIYVTGATCSKDFQVTPDAFMRSSADPFGCDAFFSKLSADASQLLYSTYLGGSFNSAGLSLSVGAGGRVYLGGQTRALDFPTTAGTFTTPGSQIVLSRVFVGVWDPIFSRFDALAAFGSDLNPLHFAWNARHVAVEAFNLGDPIQSSSGTMWSAKLNQNLLLVLDLRTWQLVYVSGLPGEAAPYAIAMESDGSLTIAGGQSDAIPPSPGAYRLDSASQAFIARLDPTGRHMDFATYFDAPVFFNATITSDLVYVTTGAGSFSASAAVPVIASPPVPGSCAAIYAVPKVVQQCGINTVPQTLYWDACDPQLASAEVHSGAPNGPLLAATTSGSLPLMPSATTYYLTDPAGRVLATEQTGHEQAPRCSAVPNPQADLTATPNPVLSCLENPTTGTQTSLSAGPGHPSEIHVGTPNGPELAYSPVGGITAQTGDWVRDGTDFFLTNPGAQGPALAMQRVFLLPIRSCSSTGTAPAPAIAAKPAQIDACGANSMATLTWYSAGVLPVEIRQSSPSGLAVARFSAASGLFDVAPQTTTDYFLVGYVAGAWKELATATVSVNASACH